MNQNQSSQNNVSISVTLPTGHNLTEKLMSTADILLKWFFAPHSRIMESTWIEVDNVGKFYVRYMQTYVAGNLSPPLSSAPL